VPLNPQEAVFEGMLAGWARQQRSRFLREESTIGPRAALVRRLAGFAGQYPWEWEPAEAEAFISHLRSGARPVAVSTGRWYEGAVRLFCEYVTDPRYEWAEVCGERFGRRPVQVFHEWNSVAHVTDYEGAAGRRPLTYDEVQALFDAPPRPRLPPAVPRPVGSTARRAPDPDPQAPPVRNRAPASPQRRARRMGIRPAPRGTGQPARRPHPDRRQLGQPHPPRLDRLPRRTGKGKHPRPRETARPE